MRKELKSALANNSPVELYKRSNGKVVAARLLPVAEAEEWLTTYCEPMNAAATRRDKAVEQQEKAEDAETLLALTKEASDAQREMVQAIRVALQAYNPEVFTDDVLADTNSPQLMYSFRVLRRLNDPLAVTQFFSLDELEEIQAKR